MTIKSIKNTRRQKSRFAVVVSKKVLKSAVGRNRIRRRVYELFRNEITSIKSPYDVVCIVTSQEIREMSAEELKLLIQTEINKAGLYKNT